MKQTKMLTLPFDLMAQIKEELQGLDTRTAKDVGQMLMMKYGLIDPELTEEESLWAK